MANIKDISVELIFNKGMEESFTLLVEGEYYAGTPDTYMEPGDKAEFLLENVELFKGKLYDLIAEEVTIESIVDRVLDQLG